MQSLLDLPRVATLLRLRVPFQQVAELSVSFRVDSNHFQGHTKELAEKIFATGGTVLSEYPDNLAKVFARHYLRRDAIITGLSEKTIIIAAAERSGSSATANHALRQGREVIITRHVNAKIEGATIVENPGELKDALDMDREGLKK